MYTDVTLASLPHNARYVTDNNGVANSDTHNANSLVKIIEASRTDDKIQPGDVLVFTGKYGDYYSNAHFEKFNDFGDCKWSVSLCPHTPYVWPTEDEKNIGCLTGGGPWENVPENLELVGKRNKIFMTKGYGLYKNGSIYFTATVNVWKYAEPDPVHGGYTTKDYNRYFISYVADSTGAPKNGSPYRYFGDGIAFVDRKDYDAWRNAFRGVEFPGYDENHKIVWTYKCIEHLITEQEWNALDLPVYTRPCNGTIKVKVVYDDVAHTVTEYRCTNSDNSMRGVKPYILFGEK